MAKKVCVNSLIEVKAWDDEEWTGISDWVTRWSVTGAIGEIMTVELIVIDNEELVIEEAPREVSHSRGMKLSTTESTTRVAIRGVDITSHVYGYDRLVNLSKVEPWWTRGLHYVRLYLQADSSILRINGTHPWEEPAGQSPVADKMRSAGYDA